jgi:hypothetical protein
MSRQLRLDEASVIQIVKVAQGRPVDTANFSIMTLAFKRSPALVNRGRRRPNKRT